MDVIRHQTVAVDLEVKLCSKLAKCLEIGQPIPISNEHRPAIVSALNDVMRVVGDRNPCSAWHPCSCPWSHSVALSSVQELIDFKRFIEK
jgi:hypothetical protein